MDTRKIVKMVYRDYLTLTPAAAGAMDYQVYRANSVYDPDQSGVGHQPSGYDQWNLLYDMYCVLGSKITVQFVNLTAVGSAYPHVVAIVVDDDIAAPDTSWRTVLETNKFNKSRMVSWDGTKPTLSMNFSTKKFFSKNPKDDSLMAAFGATPTEEAFFCVLAQPYDETNGTAGVACCVKIEYIVLMTEPRTIAAS